MKYTAILVLALVLVNGSNMRSNKGTTSHDNLVEIKSEWVGEAQDLSGNVGIISQEVTEAYTLTNQDRIEKAESKERSAIHKAINKSHKSFVQVGQIDNMPFVEETLDQSPQKEINFEDLLDEKAKELLYGLIDGIMGIIEFNNIIYVVNMYYNSIKNILEEVLFYNT